MKANRILFDRLKKIPNKEKIPNLIDIAIRDIKNSKTQLESLQIVGDSEEAVEEAYNELYKKFFEGNKKLIHKQNL